MDDGAYDDGLPAPGTPPPPDVLLEVRRLRTHFHVMDGTVPAVDGVSFSLPRGETLGVVGESGCGKSVTALTIMRLLEIPPAEIVGGEIWFDGRELLSLDEAAMRHLRGNAMAMVFQEPMTSLNPVLTVGDQIVEAIVTHRKARGKQARERAVEMLRMVGIPALDVTIQAQILELIARLQRETGASLLLITHDLGVVAETVKRVVVMYAGKVVEAGDVEQVLHHPQHPYTQGLLASIPSQARRGDRLNVIRGTVPNPFRMPKGCRFQPRCPYAFEPCRDFEPPLDQQGPGRAVACWLHTPPPAAAGAAARATAAKAVTA
jgi:oligopeptide/dipeptide ABC transporter ATP-binding protein